MGAAADEIHAQCPDSLRVMLAVAAADGDDGIRVFPAASADNSAVFLVCHRGDGAGVDDIAVARLVPGTDGMTGGGEQLLHGLGFILVDLATEGKKSNIHSKNHQNKKFAFV